MSSHVIAGRMLLLIAAAAVASIGVPPRVSPSFSVEQRPVMRVIDHVAMANAAEWDRATSEVQRHQRISKDEHGLLQLQRLFESE